MDGQHEQMYGGQVSIMHVWSKQSVVNVDRSLFYDDFKAYIMSRTVNKASDVSEYK